jgi:hypothetical protein
MSACRFRRLGRTAGAAILLLAGGASRAAAQETVVATLTANLGGIARLTVSTNTLTFPDADPDTIPRVASIPPVVTIAAKARAGWLATVTLTVAVSDDLRAGVVTIPASELSWTAAGPGFVGGTLNRSTPQLVASWSGSGERTGSQQYVFANRWSHPAGTYSLTLVYTLLSP